MHFALDGKYFRLLDEGGNAVKPLRGLAKPDQPAVLTEIRGDGRAVSFFGDLHPSFYGNVVKAMASAKQGYPIVSRMLARAETMHSESTAAFIARLDREFRAIVDRVIRLTPTIVEVVVRAPAAARRFRPGQFYRLQNFDTLAGVKEGTRLTMEGLALTGAWVDREQGLISTIVLEMGGSSDLCDRLRPGEPIVLMGPTGAPTEIAGYRKPIDRYKIEEIEAASDVVVWCTDEAPAFVPDRPQDRTFVGNIVGGMLAYAENRLGTQPIPLAEADRIIAIGSDRMMAAVAAARHGVLAPYMKPGQHAIGSINSPMQCMMKEVCAQCLQPHHDPITGKLSYVFSCFNQDQPLDEVDFPALATRLSQNAVQEKLTAQWIDHCLSEDSQTIA